LVDLGIPQFPGIFDLIFPGEVGDCLGDIASQFLAVEPEFGNNFWVFVVEPYV
jgi:hypothetical protein